MRHFAFDKSRFEKNYDTCHSNKQFILVFCWLIHSYSTRNKNMTEWCKIGPIFVKKDKIDVVSYDIHGDNDVNLCVRFVDSTGCACANFGTISREYYLEHQATFETKPWWEWPCCGIFREPDPLRAMSMGIHSGGRKRVRKNEKQVTDDSKEREVDKNDWWD